jgi:hypothetical protein
MHQISTGVQEFNEGDKQKLCRTSNRAGTKTYEQPGRYQDVRKNVPNHLE